MTEAPAVETGAGKRIHVVIGGEQILLSRAVGALLDDRFIVHAVYPCPPKRFAIEVRGVHSVGVVGLLVDPVGSGWETVADDLRRNDSHFGLVVLTARPSYGKQRRWKRAIGSERRRANALLSIGSDSAHLSEAILDAHRRPGLDSPYWLDGPKHPYAFGRTEEGKGAASVRANRRRHEVLVLAGRGTPQNVIAKRMGVQQDQIREQLNAAGADLGARSDVELGRLAAENGLLDDIEDFDSAPAGE